MGRIELRGPASCSKKTHVNGNGDAMEKVAVIRGASAEVIDEAVSVGAARQRSQSGRSLRVPLVRLQ